MGTHKAERAEGILDIAAAAAAAAEHSQFDTITVQVAVAASTEMGSGTEEPAAAVSTSAERANLFGTDSEEVAVVVVQRGWTCQTYQGRHRGHSVVREAKNRTVEVAGVAGVVVRRT